jgi:hypothetical protein
MNVYIYMKRGYDDFFDFGRRKNKANFIVQCSEFSVKLRKSLFEKTKPIRRALAGNTKHEALNLSLQLRSGQALIAVEWILNKTNGCCLKKQSQFISF